MKHVLCGIDPGGTTGLVIVSYNTRTRSTQLLHSEQYPDGWFVEPTPGLLLTELLLRNKVQTTVIEQFVGGGVRSKYANQTLRLVGYFVCLSQLARCETVLRVPQARLPFVEKARTRIAQKTKMRHSIDALAHVLSYIHRDLKGPNSRGE